MVKRNVHQSGDQQKGGGGYSEAQSKAVRAALDGVSDGSGKASNSDKGEAPATGAQRDIGAALDGRD
jgi:hypothetical protein